jgi:hypothetical protein
VDPVQIPEDRGSLLNETTTSRADGKTSNEFFDNRVVLANESGFKTVFPTGALAFPNRKRNRISPFFTGEPD